MKKILMIATQEIVTDLSDGGKKGSNRNWHLLRDVFGEENVNLIMLSSTEACVEQMGVHRLKAYNGIIDRVFAILSGRIFFNKRSERKILDVIQDEKYDIIFLDRTLYGPLVKKIKKKHYGVKIWSFSHNLEANYFRNKLKNTPFFIRNIICSIVKKSEKNTVQSSDELFVLTERDRKLNYLYYDKKSIVIPTTFYDVYDSRKKEYINETVEKKQLLFIGTMFGPNFDGIKWFINEVMPNLHNCILTVVGKNFEQKKDELQGENVKIIGTVDDLEKYYYAYNIMVMPIFYGDGQKVKTAEAMMYGKTILATNEALEGYAVDGVEGIFRCNTAEDFVEAIERIDMENISTYSYSVRNVFIYNYSYTEMVKNMARELRKMANEE